MVVTCNPVKQVWRLLLFSLFREEGKPNKAKPSEMLCREPSGPWSVPPNDHRRLGPLGWFQGDPKGKPPFCCFPVPIATVKITCSPKGDDVSVRRASLPNEPEGTGLPIELIPCIHRVGSVACLRTRALSNGQTLLPEALGSDLVGLNTSFKTTQAHLADMMLIEATQ